MGPRNLLGLDPSGLWRRGSYSILPNGLDVEPKLVALTGIGAGIEAPGFHNETGTVQFDSVFLISAVLLLLFIGAVSAGVRENEIENVLVVHWLVFRGLELARETILY